MHVTAARRPESFAFPTQCPVYLPDASTGILPARTGNDDGLFMDQLPHASGQFAGCESDEVAALTERMDHDAPTMISQGDMPFVPGGFSIQLIANRISQRLRSTGLTPRKASLDAGLGEDAIRNIQRAAKESPGRKGGVTMRTIVALAPVLQTSVEWLTGQTDEIAPRPIPRDGAEPPSDLDRAGTVPIAAYLGHAASVHFYDLTPDENERCVAPIEGSPATVAIEMRGHVQSAWIERGIFFFDKTPAGVDPALLDRKLAVVRLRDGRQLMRTIKRGNVPGRYVLTLDPASEPIVDAEIVWAAPIISLRFL